MMNVLAGLERKIRGRLRSLSSYDAVVLIALLLFTALYCIFPMPELNWDAGRLGMSGILWHDVIRNVVLTGRFDRAGEFVKAYLSRYEADFFYYPIFSGLICGASFSFFGINESAFYFNVLLFGLGSILATYVLASRLYDKRVGVISSLFLASSHALFATTKSGFIDVPATAMVTISMLAFLKTEADKQWKYSMLAGVVIGLSFMTKPTTAIAIAVMVLYSVLKYMRGRDKKIGNLIISRRFERENLRIGLRNFLIISIPASILFFVQMHVWASSDMISAWLYAFSGPPIISYPRYIYLSWILTEYLSPIVVALFMIGFVLCVSRRKNSDMFLLTWFATFMLFAIVASNRLPRYLLTLVPCLSIIAAQGLVSFHNLAKKKFKIQGRKSSIKNLTGILFIVLVILGVVNGVILILKDPYKNEVDFTDVDKSPYAEAAKFLVERAGVVFILPSSRHYSPRTLGFHLLKYDRQGATYFFDSYGPQGTMSNETFLEHLDRFSDDYDGKTVYLVVPHVYNWSREFLELLEPQIRAYLEPSQKFIAYIESHSELVPLINVFRKGELELRVYQRMKGVF